jgi:hypothetical protein
MIVQCKIYQKKKLIKLSIFIGISFFDDSNLATVYSHYSIENRNKISSINVHPTHESPTYGTRF